MKPKKRLHLEKQTLKILLDKELSHAHGGTFEVDPVETQPPLCDTAPCIDGTHNTRGPGPDGATYLC